SFGDVSVSDFVINSDSQLTVVSPAQFAGTYDIVVANAAGTSAPSASDRFAVTAATAPAITSISASTGTTAGGTTVVITGTDLTAAFALTFGDVPAEFTQDSDTQITAYAPVQAAGTVHIVV